MTASAWLAALLLTAAAWGQEPGKAAETPAPKATAEKAADGNDYIRVKDVDDGSHAVLQVAIRTFVKEGEPTIHLVGVVHIGDKAYYADLQNFLDEQDLVLFEGVKPGSAESDLKNADDAAKVKITKSRQRFLAVLVERYKAKNGNYPEGLEAAFEKLHGPVSRLAQAAMTDGWGERQVYMLTTVNEVSKFDIISLGADKKMEGEGADADVKFSQQKPLTKEEKTGGGEGIQVQLANALGLEFQLAAVNYDRAKWRNSDMTIDQLEDKMKEAGLNGSALFSMLDGSSIMSKFVGFALGMVAKSPEMSFYFKATMVEMLVHADELMETQAEALGKGMGQFMKVIVIDRNTTVFDDLKRVLKEEPAVRSIALFYGAGHLPDMEKRLGAMGYTYRGSTWKDAVDVDATRVKGGRTVLKQVKAQMKAMMPKKAK